MLEIPAALKSGSGQDETMWPNNTCDFTILVSFSGEITAALSVSVAITIGEPHTSLDFSLKLGLVSLATVAGP